VRLIKKHPVRKVNIGNCISRPRAKLPSQSKRIAHNAVRVTGKRFTVAQLRIEEGRA